MPGMTIDYNASNAREVSGDGGTGVSSGRMSVISQALRIPRVVR
jgi:hypothetical protein